MNFYKHRYLSEPSRQISFLFVYFLAIVFSYHTLLVAYTTSSYLGQFLSPTAVGALHGLAAMSAVVLFVQFPKLLKRFGNVAVGTGLMVICVALLLLLAVGGNENWLIFAMFGFLALNPLLYLVIDVFSETLIGEAEGGTGAKRGLTLGLMSAAAVFAPISMGYLMGEGQDYTMLFAAAAGVGLLFIAVMIGSFRHFFDPPYEIQSLNTLIKSTNANTNIKIVMVCHFLLQLFFAWIVVYVPLYLSTVVGFSWQDIGLIIAAGLLAYVVFEYPTGIIADKYIGEQEMMAIGFVILAITTASFGLLVSVGVVGWMILMFINRLGASLVKVTTESYFFKQVSADNAPLLSAFRLLRPAANVAGALLGSLLLITLPFTGFFIIGGLVLVSGVYLT